MLRDLDRLDELGSIIERFLPETARFAGHTTLRSAPGRKTRASDDHAMSIAYSCEYGAHIFGLNENPADPGRFARLLMEARAALSSLNAFDRNALYSSAYPDQDRIPDRDSIQDLIEGLAKFEAAARSKNFKKTRSKRASAKRNWNAMAVAYACIKVWEQERGPASAPQQVSLEGPSAFGKFVNEVLVWADERSKHGKGASATTALRSFHNWSSSQKKTKS